MERIDLHTARKLVDFSGGSQQRELLGRTQLEGAVALYNMIADRDIGMGYLADEVGTGKTYIALGVVALMRYFKPDLRVLYICPSKNVQDKWEKERRLFIDNNVVSNDFRIRTPQGRYSTPQDRSDKDRSGTPAIACDNIDSLINAATTGYYGDIFVRMTSFGMPMGNDEAQLEQRHLVPLRQRVPPGVIGDVNLKGVGPDQAKARVKKAYSRAINYLLPTFDLVVIDEAHNFKHDFNSSHRNRALSRILGTNADEGGYRRRLDNALLLSATPFDRNSIHLHNQLKLIGKTALLPKEALGPDRPPNKVDLEKFFVRRLYELEIDGTLCTRNMYRREWRRGPRAEIELKTDEQKLVTALVQKLVGDMLKSDRDRGLPSLQIGMLACFESYAQTAGVLGCDSSERREFDGEADDQQEPEARDRHIIDRLQRTYRACDLGPSLPHPKMDQVSQTLAQQVFDSARKQLVFVRRIRSVDELKEKLDSRHDEWIQRYLMAELPDGSPQQAYMRTVIDTYEKNREPSDRDTAGVDEADAENDSESRPPLKDTLFNWFFRGKQATELRDALSPEQRQWPDPASVRDSLTAKDNPSGLIFMFNWADWYARHVHDSNLASLLAAVADDELMQAIQAAGGVASTTRDAAFRLAQIAFLKIAASRPHNNALDPLIDYLAKALEPGNERPIGTAKFARELVSQWTFFTLLDERGLGQSLFGSGAQLAKDLYNETASLDKWIQRFEIHRELVAQTLRTGHGMIDVYLARLKIGPAELNESRRRSWCQKLCGRLSEQFAALNGARSEDVVQTPFSTALELFRISENLDLIIRNNLSGVYSKSPRELRRWLADTLRAGSPIMGASGQTGSDRRSLQARKFRMPGYPLVLVSTDVFQEGEDLHTFCDSVVHYGLASSPVGIEQKTGRVDRVDAYAHRRLRRPNATANGQRSDEDYIQVSYPFVKESIEALQIRKLCCNLNEFIRSLHEVEAPAGRAREHVDVEKEAADHSEIPDQIRDKLTSPYAPKVPEQAFKAMSDKVDSHHEQARKTLDHLERLIEQAGCELRHETNRSVPEPVLRSARASGAILLHIDAEDRAREAQRADACAAQLRARQAKHYRQRKSRAYGVQENDGLVVYEDAEMLVGSAKVTSAADLRGAFNRVLDPTANGKSQALGLPFSLCAVQAHLQARYQWGGTLKASQHEANALVVSFDDSPQRQHRIFLSAIDDFACFEAIVASRNTTVAMSRCKLLNMTWLRNRRIDLVELLVSPEEQLVARTFHPRASLDLEEFAFNVFVLATEADRAEYLLRVPDVY